MGIDHTTDGSDASAETVEENPDRRPPPPPDKPGTDGYPSRADSRLGAAAANDTSAQTTDRAQEQKPEASPPSWETSCEETSTATEDEVETSATSKLIEGEFSRQDDRGSGELQAIGPTQAVSTMKPEAEQVSAEPSSVVDGDEGAKAPGGWSTAQDNSTAEVDVGAAPKGTAERGQDGGARTTPSAESADPVGADTSSGQDTTTEITPRPGLGAEEAIVVSEAPNETTDIRHGHARDDTNTVAHVSEAVAPQGLSENQSRDTDKPQLTPLAEAVPIAEAKPDSPDGDRGSGNLQEKAEATEAEAPGTALAESAETRDRLERRDGTIEHGDEGNVESPNIATALPLGERLMVGDKPLREHLDPVGAAAWSNEVDDQLVDPSDRIGARIADTENSEIENNKQSRAEAFRKRFHRERESIVDTAGKSTSRLQDVLSKRPPTGHLETRTGPEATPAPHQGLDAGNVLTAGLVAGVMVAEGVRKVRKGLSRTQRR